MHAAAYFAQTVHSVPVHGAHKAHTNVWIGVDDDDASAT